MRNLKKILALVLALVMSLSLMATAGAESFQDVKDDNPYKTAIDVLTELKVVKGYGDGNFQPDGQLNRAEAAVLVYRIATGDVEDKYLDNYTFMQQSKFTDLDGYNWAKGYINYCQNAGIVVGTDATHFNPGGKVTGYQLLVMLLRTLGYGKAGEFADPKGWELQTATIAEREGITKNVTAGDFGAPAPRQMVAEILFRGLLSESVDYSALIPGGYTKTGVTLGMREFGLEQISGVVMANEWANLNDGAAGEKVLAAGTTQMKLEDGKTYTVNRSTDLDAVGLTYNAYIADGGENGTKRALTLEEGANTVAFNEGKAVATSSSDQSWTTLQKLADEESISINDNTEFFVNYSQAWNEDVTSEYLIRYAIAKSSATTAQTEYLTGIFNGTDPVDGHTVIERTIAFNTDINAEGKPGTTTLDCWVVAIRPGKLINTTDQAIMEKIFYTADRIGENTVNAGTAALRDYAIGEVYVGTTSMKDYSDDMSWNEFREEYFEDTLKSRRFATCEMGNSLRIVDNDGDGEAEYALKIAYTQAQAISGSADALILSDGLRMSKYTDNNLNVADELALDDVINYYIIDGKLSAWKADMVNGTISDKSFQNITVTVTDGDTYGQSGIVNATRLDENILAMADKTEYNMYLDEFGYIRTYELAQGKQYALLTEIYPTSSQNWNYVTTHRYIAELQAGDEARTEYMVSNSSSDIFYSYNRAGSSNAWYNSGYVWTQIANLNGQGIGNTYYNYLQPAVAHLGYNRDAVYSAANPTGNNLNNGATTANSYGDPIWGRTVYQMADNSDAFNYGTPKAADGKPAGYQFNTQPGTPVDESFSYTNIARYTMDGDEVLLNTAAEKATDRTGAQLYRTVKAIASVTGKADDAAKAYTVKNAADWKIWYAANVNTTDKGVALDTAFNTWFYDLLNRGDMYEVYATDYVQLVNNQNYPAGNRHFTIAADYNNKYFTNSNTYVDAVDTTEFYIVGPTNVLHVVGYSNLPAIDASTIRAAYAVAKNTAKDQISRDYWVADVIVIEVNKITDDFDSISLMYYNPNENTNSIRYIKSLNDSWRSLQPDYADKAMMDVVPTRSNVGSAVWGNHSWTARDYGFYFLYDTDLQSEGSMTAGNAVKVTNGQYNKNGIFAGTVSRVEDLYASNYIDVVYTDANGQQQYKHITVNSAAYETPVYRISSRLGVTTAGEISLDNDIRISDVQPGDQIIYVYKHGENGRQVAYIVDVAQDINDDGIDENGIPAWLYNAVNGLWSDIMAEQSAAAAVGSAPTMTFYGKNAVRNADGINGNADDDVFTATVRYADAPAANTEGIVVTNGTIVIADTTISAGKKTAATARKPAGVTYKGTVLGDDNKYYTYEFTQDAQDGRFGALYSTDTDLVQVVTGGANYTPTPTGADDVVIANGSDLTINTVVGLLAARGGTTIDKVSYKALDAANNEILDKSQTISAARWLELTMTNAQGETKTIKVYRADVYNNTWPAAPTTMSNEIIIASDEITGYGVGAWNAGTSSFDPPASATAIPANKKITVATNPVANNACYFFYATGEGTFEVTDTLSGEPVGAGSAKYWPDANQTILQQRITGNITVKFIPAAGSVNVYVMASTDAAWYSESVAAPAANTVHVSATGAKTVSIDGTNQSITAAQQTGAGTMQFKIRVAENYEPVAKVVAGSGTVTIVDRNETSAYLATNSDGIASNKYYVEVTGATDNTVIAVTSKYVGKQVALDVTGATVTGGGTGDNRTITLDTAILKSAAAGTINLAAGSVTVNVKVEKLGADTITWAEAWTESFTAPAAAVITANTDLLSADKTLGTTFLTGTYRVTVTYTVAGTGETGTGTTNLTIN